MSTSRAPSGDDRLLRLRQVLEICPVSKAQLYVLIKNEGFPRPLRIGARSVAWRESQVMRWIATRPEASDANWQ